MGGRNGSPLPTLLGVPPASTPLLALPLSSWRHHTHVAKYPKCHTDTGALIPSVPPVTPTTLLTLSAHCFCPVFTPLTTTPPHNATQALVGHLLEEGQAQAARAAADSGGSAKFGLLYSWHDKLYLGAAHGERRIGGGGELHSRVRAVCVVLQEFIQGPSWFDSMTGCMRGRHIVRGGGQRGGGGMLVAG